jgi:hypothetical protein
MENTMQYTFRNLILMAGKILFVLGIVVGTCSLFLGFWPGLIYFLIMLAGAGLIAVSQNGVAKYNGFDTDNFRNTIASLAASIVRADFRLLYTILRTIAICITVVLIVGLTLLIFRQAFFHKSDTLNDCREMTAALEFYKDHKKTYPDNLHTLIANNPLREEWYKDGWNRPYQYIAVDNGSSYILSSSGRDGVFDSPDDITFRSK